MTPSPLRASAATPVADAAQELVQQMELSPDLPERLLLNRNGQPVTPVSLGAEQELRSLPEQMALLSRPEPVGGWVAVLHANRNRLLEQARQRVQERQAALQDQAPAFLQALATATRTVQTLLEQQASEVEHAYTQTQELLARWQERRNTSGTLRGVVTWVLGGEGHLSLPQAIGLWNERERLALKRAAVRAALFVVTQVLSDVTRAVQQHQGSYGQLQQALETVTRRINTLARAPERGYTPWTWRVRPAAVAEVLARDPLPDQAISVLLTVASDNPADDLLLRVQALAQQEAAARLAGLDIIALLEQEAYRRPLADTDPVVLVGQALLDDLTRRPPWHLHPMAHPRVETLQITPTGEPVYRLEGLHTAAYPTRTDRLGMLQLTLDVALEEVQGWQGHEATFQATLQQRNLYVLETLARRHAPPTPPAPADDPPAPAPVPPAPTAESRPPGGGGPPGSGHPNGLLVPAPTEGGAPDATA